MTNRQSLANDIWRACDIMRRDDGTTGVMEYMEQLSWLLFLKAFEAVEDRHEAEGKLGGRAYQRVVKGEYRWSAWTAKDWRGEEIVEFVNGRLFPYLRALHGSPEKEIISTIFTEIPGNRMKSPYNLRDVMAIIDEIDFQDVEDTHVVSQVYEDLLLRMGREGGIAGEFYTPRPIVRFMVKVVDPQVGQRLYDPFCGSAGFLVESYNHVLAQRTPTLTDHEQLQRETFYGQEKKPLPCLLGMMNAILHGILTPSIVRRNTLEENIRNIPEGQRYDVILTNPPFGGREGKQIQQNFPIQSQATELLALQHVMKKLRVNGRCGIVLPEGVLFRGDAFAQVKKELLESFNLHTIVSLPAGVFANVTASGQGPKTNLVFFDRTGPTKEVWYYDLQPPNGQKYTKANAIQDEHLADAWAKWQDRAISDVSWVVPVGDIAVRGYDLTARNPNRAETADHRTPEELVAGILEKERQIAAVIEEVQVILEGNRNGPLATA
jgi:type I restriction enzyme M protein